MSVAVVIVAHDEASSIGSLVKEVATALAVEGVEKSEIVVVDDGSGDCTYERALEVHTGSAELRVLRHRQQYGQTAALITGVEHARAPWIVTLDGDGQNVPADMGRLLGVARAADDPMRPVLVCGDRRGRRKDTWQRVALSWALNLLSAVALGHGVVDKGCGLRVFRRDTFLALPRFDHMHRFLPGLVKVVDGQVVSVPVDHRPRLHGVSHYRSAKRAQQTLVDVLGILWLRRRWLQWETLVQRCEEPSSTGE